MRRLLCVRDAACALVWQLDGLPVAVVVRPLRLIRVAAWICVDWRQSVWLGPRMEACSMLPPEIKGHHVTRKHRGREGQAAQEIDDAMRNHDVRGSETSSSRPVGTAGRDDDVMRVSSLV